MTAALSKNKQNKFGMYTFKTKPRRSFLDKLKQKEKLLYNGNIGSYETGNTQNGRLCSAFGI